MKHSALLIVDSGGSKTKLALCDNDGQRILEGTTVGYGVAEDSESVLTEAVAFFADFCKEYNVTSVVCNLGGKNKKQMEITLKSAFSDAQIKVVRESEGDAALAFGAFSNASVVLLAGTGTIAVCQNGNQKCILGGWGMNIGDGGSGYDIGLSAIRETLLALDGVEPLSPLQQDISGLEAPIKPEVDAKTICLLRDRVRDRIRHTDRRAVASLVKTVAAHAARGEADALRILSDAGEKMADLVLRGLRKSAAKKELTVAVTGGLLHTLAFWQSAFENKIKEEFCAAHFVYEADGLMCGVQRIAKEIGEEKK